MGKAVEFCIAAELLSRGFDVFLPAFDSGCDLVVSKGGVLSAAQVRSSGFTEANRRSRKFDLRRERSGGKRMSRYGTKHSFTVWVLVWTPTMEVYVVPRSDIPEHRNAIRLQPKSKYLDNWEALTK
jgi:hypothetical protein